MSKPSPNTAQPPALFFTLALDAMPFITWIYPELIKLPFEWEWHVMEGVAQPSNCTGWCKELAPRLSFDGTNGYLRELASFDSRVRHHEKEIWPGGKVQMCNWPLRHLHEPRLLWQIDGDEIWKADQIVKMQALFARHRLKNCAYFRCRYHVGPKVVLTNRDGYGNNSAYEWHRVWKIEPGHQFTSHEPPKLGGPRGAFHPVPFAQDETEREGLVFDHYAYATEAQVRFKQIFYGSSNNQKGLLYDNAIPGWNRLQKNERWPVNDVKVYLPWVGDGVSATQL